MKLLVVLCAPLFAIAIAAVIVVTVTTCAVASVVVRVKYRVED